MVLKIIKHCHEEGAGVTDVAQGVLLGLGVDNRLEITNCFPYPRHTDEEDFDESENLYLFWALFGTLWLTTVILFVSCYEYLWQQL